MNRRMSEEFKALKHRGMEEFKTPMPRREVLGMEVVHDQESGGMDGRAIPSQKMQRDKELTLERSRDSKERE